MAKWLAVCRRQLLMHSLEKKYILIQCWLEFLPKDAFGNKSAFDQFHPWWCNDMEWWRQQMETFSALLAFCAGNSPVTVVFPLQRPVTRSFDIFFNLCPNKRLSKQSWRRSYEKPSSSLWRHCDGNTYSHFRSFARGKMAHFTASANLNLLSRICIILPFLGTGVVSSLNRVLVRISIKLYQMFWIDKMTRFDHTCSIILADTVDLYVHWYNTCYRESM